MGAQFLASLGEFLADSFYVWVGLRESGTRIEIAVCAFRVAEGNVDVDTGHISIWGQLGRRGSGMGRMRSGKARRTV